MSDEILKSLFTNLFTKLEYPYPKMVVKFNGSCLIKQNKFTFDKKVLNIYIVYELDRNSNNSYPKLINCFFGSVKVTRKNNDFNFQTLSGYGIGFYTAYVFTYSPRDFAYHSIVFGVDSQENNNEWAIRKGNVKINNKTVGVKASYKNNISAAASKIILSLHYNKENSFIFSNGHKITDFKAKDSEINNDPICLGNISKEFSESDTKKAGLHRIVYYFSVDHEPTSVYDIVKIHRI